MNFIATTVLSLLAVLFFPKSAWAQAATTAVQPQIQAQIQTEPVYETSSLARDIQQLTAQYRGELAEYRQTEKEYQVAKQQYQQLQTLSALEEAIRTTQIAMQIRAKVLRTYLRLLRLQLLTQPGIEIPEKTMAEQQLLSAVSRLEQHQDQLQPELDRPQLAVVAQEFQQLGPAVEEAAYRTLTALAIGRLQTVHDKAIILKTNMKTELVMTGGALKVAERQRSFEETERVLLRLKPAFDEVEDKFLRSNRSRYKYLYTNIKGTLKDIYTDLSQVLSFLDELLKI